jgi:hypothetical protein
VDQRDEVTEGWRKLHNEELRNFYSPEMGQACSMNGKKRNTYRLLVGKPNGKRPQGRQRHRWVNNIKMDPGEIVPLLWSSGQSFWLQFQRFRVRFPELPDFVKSGGSETGSTQLLRTNVDLLGRKGSGPSLENREYSRRNLLC